MKFYITKHCKERYLERVCGGLSSSQNLLMTILNDINKGKNITSKLSTEVPRFFLYIKTKYGSDKGYNIIENGNIWFITTKRKGTNNLYDVLTCYIQNHDIKRKFSTVLTNKEVNLKLSMLK